MRRCLSTSSSWQTAGHVFGANNSFASQILMWHKQSRYLPHAGNLSNMPATIRDMNRSKRLRYPKYQHSICHCVLAEPAKLSHCGSAILQTATIEHIPQNAHLSNPDPIIFHFHLVNHNILPILPNLHLRIHRQPRRLGLCRCRCFLLLLGWRDANNRIGRTVFVSWLGSRSA